MKDIEAMMAQIHAKFTPEYFEQLSKDSYREDRMYPENFSNWYYNIVDFGQFKHAEVINNQIFTYEETEAFKESEEFKNVNWEKLNKILEPTLEKMKPYTCYNIKNRLFFK